MLLLPLLVAATANALTCGDGPVEQKQDGMRGFLLTTFTDSDPSIFQYLSVGTSAFDFRPLNGGQHILKASIGTGAVRDPFIVHNKDRTEFFLLATDLDTRDTKWAEALRVGSRKLIVWESRDLLTWEGPTAPEVEGEDFGMVWAPSAVLNGAGEYDIFWATRHYPHDDPEHATRGLFNKIRTARTTDFVTFSDTRDYLTIPGTGIIDQEFVRLGDGDDKWLRFAKDEGENRVFSEYSTSGLFGNWTRIGDIPTRKAVEGPAAYWDLEQPGVLHCLLDDYHEYSAYTSTGDPTKPDAFVVDSNSRLPHRLRHGNVLPITQEERDRISAKWGAD